MKHKLQAIRGRGPKVNIRMAYLGSYLHWFNQKAPKTNSTVANWSRTIDRLRTV